MEKIIKKFLSVSDGSGDGYDSGYGYGSGDGDGYGYGSGDGDGYGYGSGDGDGSGSGDGYDISKYNSHLVYMIDNTPTLIYSVRENYAIAAILNSDMTLTNCFVAKLDNFFAHGVTLKEAISEATNKSVQNTPIEKRLEMFISKFKRDVLYPAKEFFDWHNILTGSCNLGREIFCKQNDINISYDKMTVDEFILLTKNSYGGDVILLLEEKWKAI